MSLGRISDHDLVLLDAMIINNFAAAGAHRKLVDYLGESAATTTIVEAEVTHPKYVTDNRRHILQRIRTAGTMLDPTPEQVVRIDAISTPGIEGGRMRDRGEASLIVCALAHERGRVIVLDDAEGRKLVERNRIPVATGRRLLTEMVLFGAADDGDSWRMAERCFGERNKVSHERRLVEQLARLRRELGIR